MGTRFARRRRKPAINLSALMDIAFILVIFVVLGATFQRMEDIDVTLPQADTESVSDSKGLRVVVHADGAVDVEGERIAAAEVREHLAGLVATHDSVLLVADKEASVQAAVGVLSDAQGAGFSSVAIATLKPGG